MRPRPGSAPLVVVLAGDDFGCHEARGAADGLQGRRPRAEAPREAEVDELHDVTIERHALADAGAIRGARRSRAPRQEPQAMLHERVSSQRWVVGLALE